jgi:hypothetical protein
MPVVGGWWFAVGHIGGREILYFGGSGVHYTHLGCFGARGGAGEAAERIDGPRISKFSQLGKRCQLALLGLGFAPGLVGLGFS